VLTFVVMPCLDEAELIEPTIASLGFVEDGKLPPDTHLITVDNGSTDDTLEILGRITREATAPVHVIAEPARGYVPPRRRGVVEAEMIARSLGWDSGDVLVLQADADTIYKEGYVAAMQAAAEGRWGIMLEGATRRPPEFEAAHPDYVKAERIVDDQVEPLEADDEDEVVVDDKVCGYRLADYLLWGGLFEERTAAGDAIHAETTRLFIRARLTHGVRKIRVNPAGAASSRRRVTQHPWLHYATVGFPREAAWVRSSNVEMGGPHQLDDIDTFATSVLEGRQPEAVYLRRAHQLALFRYLPALVASVASGLRRPDLADDVIAVLGALPQWTGEALAHNPGLALVQVLDLIDLRPDLFCGNSTATSVG